MEKIITRFPPSPTGYLHIGGARTALFNWLYARRMKGKFILRIEDTDTERSTQDSVDAIFEALEWLGIDWDEGPYFQSQRFDLYREHIEKLVDSGHAYYCTCSVAKLDEMRKKALAEGGKPKYDGTCREKGLKNTADAVVRFKGPLTGTTVLDDVIKGPIVFQNTELDDFIIQRSDGTPTYNLAVVVDDITMDVNTIIRGDDHVNNTPKQILLYQAFGQKIPLFGHVPMVLGSDRARLSKRHGAMSVTAYRDMGYLPEALLNYLVRLGWSYGDQEFFTIDELIEKFSLENIGKSAGIFNPEKLKALNADHIMASTPEKLSRPLLSLLEKKGCNAQVGGYLEKAIKTLQIRSKTLEEMADAALFYYQDEIRYDEQAAEKILKPDAFESIKILADALAAMGKFTEKDIEDAFKRVMDATGLKMGKIAQPVRVALTGRTASPGIFEIIEVIGKEKTLQRLNKAAEFIRNQQSSDGANLS
jgi:glutamyl-tRNA synthetase